jgi:hypothetical protein
MEGSTFPVGGVLEAALAFSLQHGVFYCRRGFFFPCNMDSSTAVGAFCCFEGIALKPRGLLLLFS